MLNIYTNLSYSLFSFCILISLVDFLLAQWYLDYYDNDANWSRHPPGYWRRWWKHQPPWNNDHKRTKRQTTCKAGYAYNAPTDYCYKYVSAAASFHNAVAACRSDGGDLISILSVGENNMLDQMALAYGGLQKVWIGFFLNPNHVWQWSDSSTVSYTNWYQNHPGPINMASCPSIPAPWSIPNKVCADFQPTGFPCNGGGNFWENTYECSQLLPYVCKSPRLVTPVAVVTPPPMVITQAPFTTPRPIPKAPTIPEKLARLAIPVTPASVVTPPPMVITQAPFNTPRPIPTALTIPGPPSAPIPEELAGLAIRGPPGT